MGIFNKNKEKISELKGQITELNKVYENVRRSLHNVTLCTYGIIESEDAFIVYKSDKDVYRPIFIKKYYKKDNSEYASLLAHELLNKLYE